MLFRSISRVSIVDFPVGSIDLRYAPASPENALSEIDRQIVRDAETKAETISFPQDPERQAMIPAHSGATLCSELSTPPDAERIERKICLY